MRKPLRMSLLRHRKEHPIGALPRGGVTTSTLYTRWRGRIHKFSDPDPFGKVLACNGLRQGSLERSELMFTKTSSFGALETNPQSSRKSNRCQAQVPGTGAWHLCLAPRGRLVPGTEGPSR